MRAKILNRTSTIPTDGWYQIEVTGTHPAGTGRKQLIDTKAITSMKNRFDEERNEAGDNWAGMLVDLDHLSHDLNNDTQAHAWLMEVEIRNNELWGKLDLTDLGENAIKNKRVKWFSTEYEPEDLEAAGDGVVRPLRLAGLAFTNRPNNRGGKPISNRTDDPRGEPNENKQPTMKNIAEKLGLPAEADEAAILAKISELQGKVTTAETKEKEAQADEILNTYKDRMPEASRASWRTRLITNRADAEQLLKESFPEGSEKKGEPRIHNRGTATTPAPVESQEEKARAEDAKQAAAIRNRASAIATSENIPFNQAFARAQAELG